MTSPTIKHDNPPRDRRARIAMHIEIAALELFLERGIENVPVEDVAAAAGISRRTFYRYFDTLEDVLFAMPRRAMQRMTELMRARPPSETLREAYFNASIEATRRNKIDEHVQSLYTKVVDRSPGPYWRALTRMHPSAAEYYAEIFAERLKLQGDDPADGELVASVVLAVIHAMSRDFQRDGEFQGRPDVVDAAIERVLGILSR